ncbi:invasion associated locus B family protein [Pelagibacterium sp.]|uniref:invasion associated locus B family protein n=1 Tax=Pelagibacterium sp. TaxID=1967288 RepID=UPI003BAD3A08
MKLKNAILAGAVATGLAFSMAGAVYAQSADAGMIDQAETSEGPAENNWLKVCSDLDDGGQACIMRQVVSNTGVFTGSFLLRDDPSQESRLLAVASVPIGVLLPFGLTWQIDSGKPVRVPYMLCDPQACSAQLVINESYIQSLKRGSTLTLTAKNRQNEDIHIDITLTGFTAVYDNPEGISIEELNQANSTENVLEQVLQDRANQLREEMENGEAAPATEEAPAQ